MKTFDRVSETLERTVAPLKRHSLLYRVLALAVTLILYSAGVLAVDAMSGDAVFPVAVVAIYFLPAVLRAWLLLYWEARKSLMAEGQDHGSHKVV